jgi:hypothetical protein
MRALKDSDIHLAPEFKYREPSCSELRHLMNFAFKSNIFLATSQLHVVRL